jgi:hypothetical protein
VIEIGVANSSFVASIESSEPKDRHFQGVHATKLTFTLPVTKPLRDTSQWNDAY